MMDDEFGDFIKEDENIGQISECINNCMRQMGKVYKNTLISMKSVLSFKLNLNRKAVPVNHTDTGVNLHTNALHTHTHT